MKQKSVISTEKSPEEHCWKMQKNLFIGITCVGVILIIFFFSIDLEERKTKIIAEVPQLYKGGFHKNILSMATRYYGNTSSMSNLPALNFSTVNGSRSLYNKEFPLLTLFTSLRDTLDRKQVHKNVLMNWSVFAPYVQPVLFESNTDKNLTTLAQELGWVVLPVPKANDFGTPYLKNMYEVVTKKFKSVFYAYSNSDILYDYGLVSTMLAVVAASEKLNNPLLVGSRTNFNHLNRTLFAPEHIKLIKEKEGKLFRADALDYFLMFQGKFPWHKVPDVVVGRPAYDNFLVGTALLNGVSVVDCTETILALHQSGRDGNYAGHSQHNKDVSHNYKVINKFNYGSGTTAGAQFKTAFSKSGTVQIFHRKERKQPKAYQVDMNLALLHNISAMFNFSTDAPPVNVTPVNITQVNTFSPQNNTIQNDTIVTTSSNLAQN